MNIINSLEKLPSDVVRKISLDLSPRDVLSLCLSNKFFQKTVCNSNNFWRNKIKIDYPKQTYPANFYQKGPKQLYMLLSMGSKIIEINYDYYAKYLRTADWVNSEDDDIKAEELNQLLKIRKPLEFMKRGDVLHLEWGSKYRNDDKFLWDGEKVVTLDYMLDDYGSVPKEFSFPEFRPDFFIESIDHNRIVRFSSDKQREIINNFNVETQQSYVKDKYNKYIITLSDDSSSVDIKYNKIYVNDDTYFSLEGNDIMLFVPATGVSGGGGGYSYENITFPPEWKSAIISVVPKNPTTEYKWDGNTLTTTK